MNKLMVEQAGSRFFELASSLGRMHVDTLTGLADATAKTPLGPVFAVNASVARMVNEGVESMATRFAGESGPAPEATSTPVRKAAAKAKPVKAKKAAKPAKAKATKSETPASVAVADTALSMEPEAHEVLVDDVVAIEDDKTVATSDDLTLISGIGATTAKKLKGAGIEGFADIAALTEDKFADLLASLDIKSIRFSPAKWIDEAKKLTTN